MPLESLPELIRRVIAWFVLALLSLFAPGAILQTGCSAVANPTHELRWQHIPDGDDTQTDTEPDPHYWSHRDSGGVG